MLVFAKLRPAVCEVSECTPNKGFSWVHKLPGGTDDRKSRLVPHHGETKGGAVVRWPRLQAVRRMYLAGFSVFPGGEDALLDCLQPFREFPHHLMAGLIVPAP